MSTFDTTGVGDEVLGVLNAQEIAARRLLDRDLDALERRQDEADRILARHIAATTAQFEREVAASALAGGTDPNSSGAA